MNQYPIMPPTQGPVLQGAAAQQPQVKNPVKPGISPAVQALMNAQARQPAPGPRQPIPGARQVQPGQQYQAVAPPAVNDLAVPQPMAKPAAYQPPAVDPTMPVTAPQPMPFQRVRGDAASTARAQMDPSMEQRMRAFGPRVR
jgi:hypothetical protein